MKKLLVLIAAACLLIPAMSFGQNPNPTLYLEIYTSDLEEPPAGTCGHELPLVGPIQCYQPKFPYNYAFVPMHIGKCPNGFLGVPYGLATSGEAITYISAVACPGFLQGAGTAPASIYFGSIGGVCQQWWTHTGYIQYLNMSTRTGKTLIDIVPNADVNHYKVINCLVEYDEGTVLGHGAQWGGTQEIVCAGDPTGVETTSWGKIKGLYR